MSLNDMYFGLLDGGGDCLRVLGTIAAIIVLVIVFADMDIVGFISIGISVIISIPIMIFLDKRKKEGKKEPWKHDI